MRNQALADLRAQFRLERKYHDLIAAESDFSARAILYERFYSEVYELLSQTRASKKTFGYISGLARNYKRWALTNVVLDFGCGYGQSTYEFGRYAKKAYGLESNSLMVSTAKSEFSSGQVEFIFSCDLRIPLPDESVDFVFCFDVVEHLHPDDFSKHLTEVRRVLRSKGSFLCFTPNRFFGPFDVTGRFGARKCAQGAHIREYSYAELCDVLTSHGFRNLRSSVVEDRIASKILWYFYPALLFPVALKIRLERLHRWILSNKVVGIALGITYVSVLAEK